MLTLSHPAATPLLKYTVPKRRGSGKPAPGAQIWVWHTSLCSFALFNIADGFPAVNRLRLKCIHVRQPGLDADGPFLHGL